MSHEQTAADEKPLAGEHIAAFHRAWESGRLDGSSRTTSREVPHYNIALASWKAAIEYVESQRPRVDATPVESDSVQKRLRIMYQGIVYDLCIIADRWLLGRTTIDVLAQRIEAAFKGAKTRHDELVADVNHAHRTLDRLTGEVSRLRHRGHLAWRILRLVRKLRDRELYAREIESFVYAASKR